MAITWQWRSQSKIFGGQTIFGGAKCLILGEQQYFCLGRRFSKHKMIRYAKNLGCHGPLPLFSTPMQRGEDPFN